MNKIVFFKDQKGREPVKEFILSLKAKAAGYKTLESIMIRSSTTSNIWNQMDSLSANRTSSIWMVKSGNFGLYGTGFYSLRSSAILFIFCTTS